MLKGVVLSVGSSCLFAGLYYYATLLHPLNGQQIFGWRMLLTLPCITLFMVLLKEWHRVVDIAQRVRRRPAFALALLCSSALLGSQQWLFLWAPLNGRALQVSLGYFLLPLTMLLAGRCVYGERLTPLQAAAAGAAALGVAHEVVRVGGFSWEAVMVATGFPVYFVLRRQLGTNHLGGLWFDMCCTLPFAAWLLLGQGQPIGSPFAESPRLYVLVPLLAVLSAAGFTSYIVASRRLSFSVFGLLGYVEPVLMVVVALALGEQIHPDEWLTYLPIWTAVALLAIDGIRHLRKA